MSRTRYWQYVLSAALGATLAVVGFAFNSCLWQRAARADPFVAQLAEKCAILRHDMETTRCAR